MNLINFGHVLLRKENMVKRREPSREICIHDFTPLYGMADRAGNRLCGPTEFKCIGNRYAITEKETETEFVVNIIDVERLVTPNFR